MEIKQPLKVLMGLSFVFLPIHSCLAGEKKLTGKEIELLLPKIIAVGENTRQTFSKAGATTYTNDGRDSYGTWRVQGDEYCSQWPPSADWACYSLHSSDDQSAIFWIDGNGNRTENTILPKD